MKIPFAERVTSWDSYALKNATGIKWTYMMDNAYIGLCSLENISMDIYVIGDNLRLGIGWDSSYSGKIRYYAYDLTDSTVKNNPNNYWIYDSNGFPVTVA